MEKKVDLICNIVVIIIIMLTLIMIYANKNTITSVSELLPITEVSTNEKVVAIACNVYEGNEQLKKIIEVLNRENVKISFFIGGIWAYRNPETLMLLKNSGQDIQNHGYYHKKPSTLSEKNNIAEIKDTEKLIYNIAQIRTSIFEPPFGDYDDNTLNIINELGYKAVTWNIDTIDWREDASEDIIIKRISKKIHPGSIILTHPKPVTANSISRIIKMIKGEGYKIITVKELLLLKK